ncbi:MAG TPA: ArsA family ATPase [Thermoplasmataceae archaeon]|nr:ArsA family ATPase [Thermoplasmataceae archaeon]
MRVLLYTGKGGVGKTSIAAATAIGLAARGYKTLIISTDPAHSLGDALQTEVGSKVTRISERLYAQEISVLEAINSHWEQLKVYLTGLFQSQGLDPVSAEEIATLPGFDDASHLLYLNDYVESGQFDVVVMDSAPTGESLKLLSFPEAMTWYMEKLFPLGRTTAKIMRPIMKPILGIPLPGDEVFRSMESLYEQLRKIREKLSDPKLTSIRLVCNPERMSVNETKRAFTYLLLFGYPVDALVINKIYPDDTGDFFQGWRESQRRLINELESDFADVKVFRVPLSDSDPSGKDGLTRLYDRIYGDDNPVDIYSNGSPMKFGKDSQGYFLDIRLPFADKKKISLYNKGGELIVDIDNWRRIIYLPSSLSDKSPVGAEFINGYLHIRMN